jgi:hypothetical protein
VPNGLLRTIIRGTPLGFLDEEEKKRRQRFQESINKLFKKGTKATLETVGKSLAETKTLYLRDPFREFTPEEEKIKEKRLSRFESLFKPAKTKEEKKKKGEALTEVGLFWSGVAAKPDRFLQGVAKKLKLSPELVAEKIQQGADPVLKSVSKQLTKRAETDLITRVKAPFINFEDAVKSIESKVRVEPQQKKFFPSFSGFWGNLKEKLVDSFSPIADAITAAEKTGRFKLLVGKDPRFLRDRVLGAVDIANQSLKKDLEPILKRVGANNIDEFDRYLAARLERDLAKQGFKTAIDPAEAGITVDRLAPKYEPAAQQVTNYTQKVLRYVRDGGLISNDLYNILVRKYPRYVPLNRVFDDLIETGTTSLNRKAIASLSQQSVVLGRKGSEREIMSPLSNIIDKTHIAVNQVERNRVAQSIVNLKNLPQFRETIRPVGLARGKNTISTFIDGRKQFFEVPPEFEVAAKNLNKQQMNVLIRAMAVPLRLARLGFTGVNLPFVATNFVRDQLFTILTSPRAAKTSAANPYNWTKALYDTVKGGGLYDDFLAAGGGWSTFFQQGRLQGRNSLKDILRGRGERVARTITNPSKWLETIEDLVSRFGEQPTRVQQFGGTLEALGARGLRVEPLAAPGRAQAIAAQAGRRNSTDFGVRGAYGDVLNSVFIYLNAGIQGARTAVRAVQTNPAGTGAKIAATLFAPVTAVTLWNVATPERKAAYEDIPEWERANNLIILPPVPQKDEEGHFIGAVKVPLPFNFSALTIPVRKGIEHIANVDQVKVRDALAVFLGFASPIDVDTDDPLRSVVSRFIPTAIQPFAEAEANIKFFTGTPIVPRAKEDLPPEMQTRFDTSAFITRVGQLLNFSPAKLQNFVQSFSGGVGLQVLNAIDRGMVASGLAEPEEVGGRSILADLERRFAKVGVGRKRELAFKEVEPFKQKAAARSFQEKEAAENIFAELKELPRGQWRPRLSQLKQEGILNEKIFNRISELDKTEAVDLTGVDKFAISLPVVERAEFILNQLDELDPSEHQAFLSDLKRKGVLTKRVFEELQKLGFRLS